MFPNNLFSTNYPAVVAWSLEVERLPHKLHDSTSMGSNPARRKKRFP